MEIPRVHIVIPAFREGGRIPGFLGELCEEMGKIKGATVRVVDDGSGAEETALMRALIDKQREASPCLLPLLELEENLGKGGAVYAGWRVAPDADVLGFVDADGSCPAVEVARLAAMAGAERGTAIFGSRLMILGKSVERKLLRHVMGRVYATLVSSLFKIPVYDSQCGLKFVPAEAFRANEALLRSAGFAFDAELLVVLIDAGIPVKEEPIDWKEMAGGHVSLFRDPLRMARDLFAIRRRRKERGWKPEA